MGSTFASRHSPRGSPTQGLQFPPAKGTKDFPFLSPALNFQYPPSRKSVRKRPRFLIQSTWSSKQPLRKKSSPSSNCEAHLVSSGQLIFQDSCSKSQILSSLWNSPPYHCSCKRLSWHWHRSKEPGSWGTFYCCSRFSAERMKLTWVTVALANPVGIWKVSNWT